MNKKMILGAVAATLSLVGTSYAGGNDGRCCASDKGSMQSTSAESTPSEVRLASLLKTPVTTKDGRNLGEVQDLVIDAQSGKIQSALVGQGSTFGSKDKPISVPWEAVTLKPPQKQFTLTVDDDQLASDQDQSEMSDMDQTPTVTIYRFYAVPDDEQDMGGATTPGGMEEGQGSSDDSSADVPSNQPDTDSDADTVPHA